MDRGLRSGFFGKGHHPDVSGSLPQCEHEFPGAYSEAAQGRILQIGKRETGAVSVVHREGISQRMLCVVEALRPDTQAVILIR